MRRILIFAVIISPAAILSQTQAPVDYEGFTVPNLTAIQPAITISRTSGVVPFAVYVTAMNTTATGSNFPYDELEYYWNFGDSNVTEFFTHPVSGETVDANSGQRGPEAAYLYRNSGTFTITLTVRGWTGSSYVTQVATTQVVVADWSGQDRYFDPINGNDSNSGTTSDSPWQSSDQLNSWLQGGDNRRAFIKRGTTMNVASSLHLYRSNIRLKAYGTGAKPILSAAQGADPLLHISDNDSNFDDHVYTDIVFDGNNGHADNILNMTMNKSFNDIAFVGCEFINSNANHLIAINKYLGGIKGVFFWDSQIDRNNCSGQGIYAYMDQFFAFTGGSLSDGGNDNYTHHHIYPDNINNCQFRWIDFQTAITSNYCINNNTVEGTDYVLIDGCDITGTNNGIDWGVGENEPTRFNNCIVQNSAIHDLGNKSEGYGIVGENVNRIIVRNNLFYNVPYFDIGIDDPTASIQLYGNKFWKGTGHDDWVNMITLYASQSGNVVDNIMVIEDAGGARLIDADFTSHSGWLVDRNQYWAPNQPTPFGDTSSDSKTFAEWQAAGFDTNGSVRDPKWRDPANGDFSSEDSEDAEISLSKSLLNFGATTSGDKTSDQQFAISNTGQGTLNWSISDDANWLSCTPTSGTGDAVITVSVDPTGLAAGDFSAAGTYLGTISVTDPNATNSPQTGSITLIVYDAGADSAPIGSFDTPIDNSTVSGSIPVTGWALDDIQVEKVEIKREPHADDPAAAIGADGLVWIGNGIFVKGARTDVEAAYPNYPNNDKAGWGYMMLTYGLPNKGNGTFTIYAFAYDETGHRIEIGRKTIVCDNARRMKPFGTIDTPLQGGVVSGSAYVNFGWALTPPPKMIPTDGSTMNVYINSVRVGSPTYNQPRSDIANDYPDYLNKDGAAGYFYINTTQYTNGVHTIGWDATDDQGEADGMGSRFFEIQNVGGSSAAAAGMESMRYVEDITWRLKIEVEGEKEIEIEELGRIELRLKGEGGTRYIGWAENKSIPLPIGSTLEKERGIFYWMPGPGFLRKHTLHFAITDGTYMSKPVKITVNIVPKKYERYERNGERKKN